MDHCEIDGSKLSISYAKPKSEKVSAGDGADSGERPAAPPADQGAVKGERTRGGGSSWNLTGFTWFTNKLN